MQIEGGRMIPGNVPDGSGAQVILEFPRTTLAEETERADPVSDSFSSPLQ